MKLIPEHLVNQLQADEGKLFIEAFRKGNVSVEMYKPNKLDLQTPHNQDEIYVIARGSGMFKNGEEHYPFKANDLIFVHAFVDHRFYDFTDDFCTWVIFV